MKTSKNASEKKSRVCTISGIKFTKIEKSRKAFKKAMEDGYMHIITECRSDSYYALLDIKDTADSKLWFRLLAKDLGKYPEKCLFSIDYLDDAVCDWDWDLSEY